MYERFAETLKGQGYKYIYAVIVDTNEASIALHMALGFEQTGHFENIGYKLGKWRGIVWMKKPLDEANEEPEEPKPFQVENWRMGIGQKTWICRFP